MRVMVADMVLSSVSRWVLRAPAGAEAAAAAAALLGAHRVGVGDVHEGRVHGVQSPTGRARRPSRWQASAGCGSGPFPGWGDPYFALPHFGEHEALVERDRLGVRHPDLARVGEPTLEPERERDADRARVAHDQRGQRPTRDVLQRGADAALVLVERLAAGVAEAVRRAPQDVVEA